MDFTVQASDDEGRFSQSFGGDASYEVGPSGVLVIRDGKGQQLTYSPAAWFLVQEATSPDITVGQVPRRIR